MAASYQITAVAGKGRAAIAVSRLSPGARVLSTDAYAVASLTACNGCFATAALQRCSGCRLAHYCSRQCQQRDWTHGGHRLECSAWNQIPRVHASQTVLLVARLAAKVLLTETNDRDAILQLQDHYDDYAPSKQREFAEMAQLVLLILTRSKANVASLDYDALLTRYERPVVELFGRVNCNAFAICNDVNVPVGIGMFPDAAVLNHSCTPNCVVSFRSPQRLEIHAITPITPGEELTISYVELLEATPKRRHALRTSYCFECDCSRCLQAEHAPEEDWVLDGFACQLNSCKTGVVVITDDRAVCQVCGHEANRSAIEDGLSRLEAAEAALGAAKSTEQEWALHQEIWRLIDEELRCHSRSTRYANASRTIGNFLIDHGHEISARESALSFLLKERDATASILPTLALPSRGLLSFQLAKLSAGDDAIRYVCDALSVLSIALGRANRMVHAAQAYLDELSLTNE